MPDWLIPVIATGIGGGGVGSIITALVKARGSGFDQMNTVVVALQAERAAMQAERAADRADNAELSKRVDHLYTQLGASRDYQTSYEEWCASGHPDPPGRPVRPGAGIITAKH